VDGVGQRDQFRPIRGGALGIEVPPGLLSIADEVID
jgi:hypothetical protein